MLSTRPTPPCSTVGGAWVSLRISMHPLSFVVVDAGFLRPALARVLGIPRDGKPGRQAAQCLQQPPQCVMWRFHHRGAQPLTAARGRVSRLAPFSIIE